MLGYLFGFNARIGRLHYFLGSVVLAIVTTAIIYAVASSTYHRMAKGMSPSLDQMKWPVIVIAVMFGLATFMLQSMRFRDIGWDPVCVIPGWIALAIVDSVVAAKIPAVSLGHEHHGTIVGALANLGLVLALTFWPSGSQETATPTRCADLTRRHASGTQLRWPRHASRGWRAEISAAGEADAGFRSDIRRHR
jgi:uncharacterized membrane protein YhaH (DUF805 family)